MSLPSKVELASRAEGSGAGTGAGSRGTAGAVWKRIGALAGLLAAELLVISVWLDGDQLAGQSGLAGQIGAWGAWVLRGIVGFVAAFVALAGMRNGPALGEVFRGGLRAATGWSWLGVHGVAMAAFVLLSAALYGDAGPLRGPAPDATALGWLASGTLALVSAALAFFPPAVWTGVIRASGQVWIYAAGVATAACLAIGLSQSLWRSAAGLTFQMVEIILRPIIPALTVYPEQMMIRGNRFSVIINEECSGLEGAALMLVFGATFLWLFRSELRFPRAFLLLPAGVVILYCLNAVRIAALLLIGDAGAKPIAAGGFHSQAGWIAFNGVAFGLAVLARRQPWFALHPPERTPSQANPTAVYLLPFLAIIGAGMVAGAASSDFEWLYPLRFLAAGVAWWSFRRHYRALDWRCGPLGVAIGVAVFVLWIGLDWIRGERGAGMPTALAGSAASVQMGWIAVRALAATVTVPAAEELAFRGFLMRWFTGLQRRREFNAVELGSASWLGVAASSLLFGLLHGERWIAGTLAGLLYAAAARRANRIGEAAVAHGITNGLLVIWVLGFGQWQHW